MLNKKYHVFTVALLLSSSAAFASDNKISDAKASVTVKNAIDMQEDESMSFGTITAVAGTTAATAVINPQSGSIGIINKGGSGDASILQLEQGNAAQFSISGAASFSALQVTLPNSSSTLTLQTDEIIDPTVKLAEFTLETFTIYDKTAAATPTASSGTTFPVTTDATGSVAFSLGATLSTGTDASFTYVDGTYEGTYEVSVSY